MVEYQKGDICPENEYGKAKDEKQAKRWPVTLRANGTAKYPFAYEPVAYKSKVLIPHWDRIQWIELAFQHLENGHSLRETAAWLGDKTGKTISYNGLNNLWRKQKGRKQTPRSKKLKEARKAREEKLTPEDKQERDINRKVGAERRRITNALKRLQNLDKKKGNTPSPVMEVEPVASSKGFVATSDTLIEEPQADIIFQPNPGPQTDFLAATEMEILYGGPLTLDTRVVTVNGYTPIGELSVGDIVFTPEGKQTAVVDIPFEGTEESYEITFDDGTKITASAGHRWLVSTGDWRKTNTPYRERKTYELFKEFKLPNGRARFGVPYTAPLQWPERSHVIHPYVMGALLGDGSFSKGCPSMTSIDPEIKGYIQRHLPDTHYLWETPSSIQGRIRRMGKSGTHRFTPDIFLDEIKRLGLYGTYSDTKFIPSEYLHDSVMNRIHLLRGMMDTDGTVRSTKHNRRGAECKYTTISPTLANDFIYLADSLGYRVTYHTEERPSQTPIYRIYLAGPINPFNLVRKYERVNEFNRHYRHRMIVDVVAVGTCKVRCITVDDPSHLFLTERFIPTFNSAGGGKTYAMLADPLRYFGNPNFNGILFRRTNDELREIIWKAQELYPKAYPGAKWSEKKSQWVFPSGARIWFTYLERDEDVLRYQGMAFSWIGFDELTQYPTPFTFNYMRSRLRTTDPTLPLCLRCTTNPGGPGHGWVKKMFIDPAPPNMTFAATDLDTGQPLVFPEGHPKAGKPLFYRRFIPAKLFDNPYLSSDGVYEANLLSLPENQRRQLLEGDWNVADGAAFSEFREHIHTCDPFDIPPEWTRFRSCDFGYSSNSAVHWYAIDPSFDTLYVYRELYTSKLTAAELAAEILSYEAGEKIYYGVLDSSSWHKRGHTGPSIAEEMIRMGCRWRPADRTAGSRIAGKNRLHQLLRVDPVTEKPGIIFFNTCRQIIADLPVIPSDPKGSEDIDVRYASDHTYDSIRYGIMSRPRSYFDFDTGSTKIRNWQPADPVFGY